MKFSSRSTIFGAFSLSITGDDVSRQYPLVGKKPFKASIIVFSIGVMVSNIKDAPKGDVVYSNFIIEIIL